MFFCKGEIECSSESIKSAQWPIESGQAPAKSEYANHPARKYKDDPEYRGIRGPLHHYTSLDALLSIVKSKSLRATNVHYLNDSSESELGLKLMKQVGEEARKTAQGIDAEFLAYFLEWLDERVFGSASVYVLCFSEAHNQLSQWRGYTQHGRGVCLSIDLDLLIKRMQTSGWTFHTCRYSRASQLTWAESILSRMRREAATNSTGIESEKKKDFDAVLQKNLSDLLQVAAIIKDEGFIEEREVRFISPIIDVGDERIEYRVGKSALIPYVQFRLVDGAEDLAISEIMVGPSPTQHLTATSIAGVVKQNSLKGPCSVSLSKIPYREL